MAKKKAVAYRGPKLSEFVIQQRIEAGDGNADGATPQERIGTACTDGRNAFEFLLGLEAKGWSAAKIIEFARKKHPTWYQNYLLNLIDGFGDRAEQRENDAANISEAADNLENGLHEATSNLDYVDSSVVELSAKFVKALEAEIARLRTVVEKLELETDTPLVRLTGNARDGYSLEIVE